MTGRRDRASRAWLVAALAALGFAVPAAPAIAVDQTVQVGNDKTLSPAGVTIEPGDRVTWRWVGPDTDHIIAAVPESWDSDPGVPPDAVSHAVGDEFSHTFATAGRFSYLCRVHPDKMQGTVDVAAAPVPVASFTATPSTVLTGEAVSFDASGSSVQGGTIVRHQWDLDGDGSFETDTGADPRASRAYSAAGTVTVRLRVSDVRGASADTTRSLTVNPAPAAAAPLATAALAPTLVAASLRDAAPPASRLNAARIQRALRKRAIVVTGSCNEDCMVAVAATITVPGARALKLVGPRRSIRAGARVTFTLRLSGRALTALRRAMARGARVSARVTLSATDAAGNASVARLSVRLAR